MEFCINKDVLFKGLQKTQGIVAPKGAMPVLSNILLEAREGEIFISATDLDIGLEGRHSAEVATPGRLTINAKKIFDIVRELPDEKITIKTDSSNRLSITCKKSKFKIAGTPAEEFPALPVFEEESNSFELKKEIFRDLIRKTIYAASTDTTRRNLNGTLLELGGSEIKMVGTDGHRLAVAISKCPEPITEEGKSYSVILPKKSLVEILKFLEDDENPFTFHLSENHTAFRMGKFHMVSRLVDDQFPSYLQVIPADNNCKVVVDRVQFLHALKRVSIMADENSKLVRLEFESGQLTLLADNTDIGEAVEEMEIDYSGQKIPIGLNASYIMDALNNIASEKVDLFLKDERSSCLITPFSDENYKCVVMPMRLK